MVFGPFKTVFRHGTEDLKLKEKKTICEIEDHGPKMAFHAPKPSWDHVRGPAFHGPNDHGPKLSIAVLGPWSGTWFLWS
jgi:hypothetical protein